MFNRFGGYSNQRPEDLLPTIVNYNATVILIGKLPIGRL